MGNGATAPVRHVSHLQGHLRSPTHVQPGEVVVGAVFFVLLIEHEVIVLSRSRSSKRSFIDVESHCHIKCFHHTCVTMSRAAKRSSSIPKKSRSFQLNNAKSFAPQHTSFISQLYGSSEFCLLKSSQYTSYILV